MAAVLSADMHNTDKVVTIVDECRTMKLEIISPDVSVSEFKFAVDQNSHIVYGLGAVKGVGEGPVECIVAARESGGAFKDLFDFCQRVDPRKVNRRSLEALIKSGAMDNLGPTRAVLMASLNEAIKAADQHSRNQDAGMSDLFGSVAEDDEYAVKGQFVEARDWGDEERLSGEKDTLGLYLTGHPIDRFEKELSHFVSCRIADLKPNNRGGSSTIAGFIIAMRMMKNKRGNGMAFATLDDKSGRIEVSVFSEAFSEYRHLLQKDDLLVVEGEASVDDFSGSLKVKANKLMGIAEARNSFARQVMLKVDGDKFVQHIEQNRSQDRNPGRRQAQGEPEFAEQLQHMLEPYRNGHCRVCIQYDTKKVAAQLYLGEEWRVTPKEELLNHLRLRFGKDSVQVKYR